MTSPTNRLSLEEVLDEFFFSADQPSPSAILHACKAYPEYRRDILEFAALWTSYEASPAPTSTEAVAEVSEDAVSRLQSFVLNRMHELDSKPTSESDEAAARAALAGLAGGKLKRAAAAAGLGTSTVLLTKAITRRFIDLPTKVVNDLARYLNVTAAALERCFGQELADGLSYKASSKPSAPQIESWESAVRALPVTEEEKRRLLALQGEEDAS
ncbi:MULTISPECIES: hypothetical protein [Paraburkholderia]|uniref:hypothetical protein n=1 Tax=Paraburkholderia TaxID=1822464 RepID=UPI0038BE0109